MAYTVIANGPARPWEITGGLQEGYEGNGYMHEREDVVRAHADWQEREGMILGGMVSFCRVSYAFPRISGGVRAAQEPGWIVAGTINTLYDADLGDDNACGRVLSLAAYLGERLGQTRVYARYRDQQYILEAADGVTP